HRPLPDRGDGRGTRKAGRVGGQRRRMDVGPAAAEGAAAAARDGRPVPARGLRRGVRPRGIRALAGEDRGADPGPEWNPSMKTQAAILVETGKPIVIGTLEIPKLKKGQVIVEIAFSGVCHTQILEARGRRGPDKFLPHCLGHEGSGTVVEVGEGVTKVKPGDQVVLSWIKGSGLDGGGTVYAW